MAYIDVIPLLQAKTYLGVDDTSRDAEITSMIETALELVELQTNVITVAVDREYIFDDNNCVLVYDDPINTLDTALASTVTRTKKTGYSVYEDTNSNNDSITLNVGYTDPANVPETIVNLALIYIRQLYDEGEIKQTPESKMLMGPKRRFII